MILRLLLAFGMVGITALNLSAQTGSTGTVQHLTPTNNNETRITQTVNDFLKALYANETEADALKNTAIFFHPSLLENGLPNLDTRIAIKSALEHKGWYASPVKISSMKPTAMGSGSTTYSVQLERMPVVGGTPPPVQFSVSEKAVLITGFKGL